MANRDYQLQCEDCKHVTTRSKLVEDADGNLRCPKCDALMIYAMKVISEAHYARRERVRQ